MWPISTVPFCTASSACSGGTISPPAKVWIWNLPSVASETNFAIVVQAPNSVSSDFGQLAVMRHFSSGIDCAIAGLAIALGRGAGAECGQEFTSFHQGPPVDW